MTKLKQSLSLQPDEDKLLRALYTHFGVPSDRFPQHPEMLQEFLDTWRDLSGRQDSSAELLHYIFTQRKRGLWVKLGRKPKSKFVRDNPRPFRLTDEDWKKLDEIYEDLQIASDNFALDEELGKKLTDEFARRTNKIVPTPVLCAAMITRRKGGAFTTLRPRDEDDLGFRDIDEVIG